MSVTWYAKIDCNFHSNRKALQAGRLGREIYVFALCINAQRGALGEFPAEDLEPWYIAQQLQMSEAEASEGVRRCVEADLIEIDDGLVRLCGWSSEYGKYPLSRSEIQQRYRDRKAKKEKPKCEPGNENVTALPQQGNALPPGDPALPPVTQVGRKEGREGEKQVTPASTLDLGALAKSTWRRLSDIRLSVAREIGLRDVLGFTEITPATTPIGFRDLVSRLREEGANAPAIGDRVLAVLEAQARKTRSIEWLSEKAFSEKAWRYAKEQQPPVAAVAAPAAPRKQFMKLSNGQLVEVAE